MSQRRKPLPKDPFNAKITAISHDGRGIAYLDNKTTFIANALPGEEVVFQYISKRAQIAEGNAIKITNPSEHRVTPQCEYFMHCGGCSLQHIDHQEQRRIKQNAFLELMKASTKILPQKILEPIVSDIWAYRRKARLGVRYVNKKEKMMVGFREKYSNYLTEMNHCEILHPSVGQKITDLATMIRQLSIYSEVPQVEVAVGDEVTALIIRHLKKFDEKDIDLLKQFGLENKFDIYLQSGGVETIKKLFPEDQCERLFYHLKNHNIKLAFHPSDFVQVNFGINHQMVDRALEYLQLSNTDQVLDLFCGLGNFTLPMAKVAKHVVGVEGSDTMVERAYENAKLNGLENLEFHAADLSKNINQHSWAKCRYDKILLDPPRSGAFEILEYFNVWRPERIVYISCNPSTLARDAAKLLSMGYTLEAAGIMDMFPHTSHVESMAVFSRSDR